jgi:PAS domain-containing protein
LRLRLAEAGGDRNASLREGAQIRPTGPEEADGAPRPPGRWPEASAPAPDGDGARFRAIADVVPHLVWTSGPAGRWTWANCRWTEYTGLFVPDARGHGWLDAVHPGEHANLWGLVRLR